MVILGKEQGGYIINCRADGESHKFTVERLGETVSCPACGHSESWIDLMTNYIYLRRAVSFGKTQMPVLQPMHRIDAANDAIYSAHCKSVS